MHACHFLVALCATAVLTWEAPQYRDFNRIWHDDFRGDEGVLPNPSNWNIIDADIGVNNELQILSCCIYPFIYIYIYFTYIWGPSTLIVREKLNVG
jgi:hypothetical protein